MSADMYVARFLRELAALPPFAVQGTYDPAVHRAPVPAWRATFTAGVLARHVAGYRLPTYAAFEASYLRNLREHPAFAARFAALTVDGGRAPTPAFRHRLGGWYETGLGEVYVYVTLAHVVEDVLRDGVVVYDARVDWKGKCDVLILRRGEARMVDTHHLGAVPRARTERARDARERATKARTSGSAHWDNAEYRRLRDTALTVTRSDHDREVVNGVALFSVRAMNALLRDVYDWCGTPDDRRVALEALRAAAPGEDVYAVQATLPPGVAAAVSRAP